MRIHEDELATMTHSELVEMLTAQGAVVSGWRAVADAIESFRVYEAEEEVYHLVEPADMESTREDIDRAREVMVRTVSELRELAAMIERELQKPQAYPPEDDGVPF